MTIPIPSNPALFYVLHFDEVPALGLIGAIRLLEITGIPASQELLSIFRISTAFDVFHFFHGPFGNGDALHFVAEFAVKSAACSAHEGRKGKTHIRWPDLRAISAFLVGFVAALEGADAVQQILLTDLLNTSHAS